jgi:protein-disulfide isomerase
MPKVVDGILTTAAVAVLGTVVWNGVGGSGKGSVPRSLPAVPKAPISLAGAQTLGSETARVVLVEYSDFQCPFCAVYARTILPTIEKSYVSTGKVLLAFRHHPLERLHQSARAAARAADCAGQKGEFWRMHDLLFASPSDLGEAALIQRATTLDLNASDFVGCLRGNDDQIDRDIASANALGLRGTPAFIVGLRRADGQFDAKRLLMGLQNARDLTAALDDTLASRF